MLEVIILIEKRCLHQLAAAAKMNVSGWVPYLKQEAGGWRLVAGGAGGRRLIELVTPSAKARWWIYNIYIYIYM